MIRLLIHKLSYDRDQLYLKSCRSAQTFSTRRHKLKFQLVAVSSIGDLSRPLEIVNTQWHCCSSNHMCLVPRSIIAEILINVFTQQLNVIHALNCHFGCQSRIIINAYHIKITCITYMSFTASSKN